jgi:hypothetical protein
MERSRLRWFGHDNEGMSIKCQKLFVEDSGSDQACDRQTKLRELLRGEGDWRRIDEVQKWADRDTYKTPMQKLMQLWK